MTSYQDRKCLNISGTYVHHTLDVPACCPITGNPLAGSAIRISYMANAFVCPVETLADMIAEYVGGHPQGIREMEAMIQHIALRVVKLVRTRCRVKASLLIRPFYGGEIQRMTVTVNQKYQ